MRKQVAVALLCLVASAFLPHRLSAKLCGDDVRGEDVPCACGDMIAGDVVLDGDPVTVTECRGNGLIVRAGGRDRPVTIDLHGATLRGSGRGAGLLVLDGGKGGARIVSTGATANLVGFFDGIVAYGGDTIGLIDRLAVAAPRRDGVRVGAAARYRIRNVEVRDAGRHGFFLSGKEFRLQRTRAWNSRGSGYVVLGNGATLGAPGAGVAAIGSGGAALRVGGAGHRIVDCVAGGGAGDGVRLNGAHYVVRGCRISGNRGDGMSGVAMDTRMARNRAEDNAMHGIVVHGHNVVDQGGNGGVGNRAERGARAAIQCEIGGNPCSR